MILLVYLAEVVLKNSEKDAKALLFPSDKYEELAEEKSKYKKNKF